MAFRRGGSVVRGLGAVVGGVAVVALCVYVFSGAYRAGLRQQEVPQSEARWVSGAEVLKMTPEEVTRKYGAKLVHQSWKTHRVPLGQMTTNFVSWSRMHPDALHIMWNDEENREMVHRHYPEFEAFYWSPLLTNVQRADLARVLYLHLYGGLYADLDYEARADVFAALPQTKAKMFVVRSPTLMHEVMQNSLMISLEPRLAFWYETVKAAEEIVRYVAHPGECYRNKWSGCSDLELFHHPLTRKVVNLIFSAFMTGPAVLDRTFALHIAEGWKPDWQIELLPLDKFFIGTVAKHYQFSTWVSIPWAIREIIGLIVLGLLTVFASGALSMRWYLRRRVHAGHAGAAAEKHDKR